MTKIFSVRQLTDIPESWFCTGALTSPGAIGNSGIFSLQQQHVFIDDTTTTFPEAGPFERMPMDKEKAFVS
ncbi:hypothetical protein [Maribellus sediminis]|uniref:hypothetical protein n=1 Tax=Maribellus sediminis TaxID=2696285 RepID=UPI001431EA47|nr:hypothetical protein [Maribellus sediminis]